MPILDLNSIIIIALVALFIIASAVILQSIQKQQQEKEQLDNTFYSNDLNTTQILEDNELKEVIDFIDSKITDSF